MTRPNGGSGYTFYGHTNEAQSHETLVTGTVYVALVPGATYTVRLDKVPETIRELP